MVIASPLCAADPIKVPLTTTAVSGGRNSKNTYLSPLYLLDSEKRPGWFRLNDAKPTQTFTIGGLACTVEAGPPETGKLYLKTPTQNFIFNTNSSLNAEPMELTLENGRKYPLRGSGSSYAQTDPKTGKESISASVLLWPASIQTGKIGNTPIAIYDSNVDGFYTSNEDGIVIGTPLKEYNFVQPLSKYISTPDGIFEVRNLAKDGSELTVIPYSGPTASLEVITPRKYAGRILLASFDAGLNVTTNGKSDESVTVIPGDYTVLTALLDTKPLSLSMWVTGVGMPKLKVEAGTKQVLTLSGPKVLEFQASLVDGKVNIQPKTIHTKGQAGETYLADYDPKTLPKVYLNVDGKSTLLGETMLDRAAGEYFGDVPADINLKAAKEVTVTLKMHLLVFGELAATVPLKMP